MRTVAQKSLVIDGISVLVTYKTMKNITLRVKTENNYPVHVSAPVGTPDFEIEKLVHSYMPWISKQLKQQEQSTMARANNATPEEVAAWRAIVEGLTPGLIERWSAVMGVTPGKLAYRNMKSRWGSCQPSTGRICINVRLALYPPQCLEYVVVHELAHLIVRGHGPEFHAVLDRYLPTWRDAKKLLR